MWSNMIKVFFLFPPRKITKSFLARSYLLLAPFATLATCNYYHSSFRRSLSFVVCRRRRRRRWRKKKKFYFRIFFVYVTDNSRIQT